MKANIYDYIDFVETLEEINEKKIKLLKSFSEILTEENKKINLISRKDIESIFEHHILHSLMVAKLFRFNKNDTIIDIGTGGGLPGIPLAIYFNENKFTLIDSINKKINVLKIIAEKLNLNNVEIECIRSENIKKNFDIIIGRGVTNINAFYNMNKHILKENGRMLYLNGINDKIDETAQISVKYHNLDQLTNLEYYKTKQIVEIKKLS